jgi:hypothetical protein
MRYNKLFVSPISRIGLDGRYYYELIVFDDYFLVALKKYKENTSHESIGKLKFFEAQ